MERIILVNCAVFCVAIFLFGIALSSSDSDDNNQVSAKSEQEVRRSPYLWFGPRTGKRKRNPSSNEMNSKREQLSILLNDRQESPRTRSSVNNHVVNCTPKLRMESEDEFVDGFSGNRWVQDQLAAKQLLSQRSLPIEPWLRRYLSPFYPHMVRDDKNQME